MLNISKVSFMKRAVSVLTASMVLLSGIVLTAAPASAASTERVPYTYTVNVPVTKTVEEYRTVKETRNGKEVRHREKVEKTVTERRVETRIGYRDVLLKVADKPAVVQYEVQVSPTSAFTNVTKEILATPSDPGTNKVNLSSQLSGSVGDTVYVRVVAKNAAGKSTPGKAAKLTFGEVKRENYDVQVSYPETGTRVKTAGYWDTYTDTNKPEYRTVNVAATYGTRWINEPQYEWIEESYQVSGAPIYGWRTQPAYAYINGYSPTYEYKYIKYHCSNAKCTSGYPVYDWVFVGNNTPIWVGVPERTEYVIVDYEPDYTAYRTRPRLVADGYNETYLLTPAYSYQQLTGYGTSSVYIQPTYEDYSYTAYRTETGIKITDGWKAASN